MDKRYQEIARFYNDVYYGNVKPVRRPSNHLSRLADRLHIASGQRILDVACGTGGWLAICAERGAKVSGIDISGRAIEICRQLIPEGEFHTGLAETLPFPDNQFDWVTCLGSLEHFLDQKAALREMERVAKPNGQFLILVPNAGFLTYRLGLYRGTHQQTVRETIRSLEEWNEMFGECGIEVRERWKDLHVLSWTWIIRPPWHMVLPRLLQGLALLIWPLDWQYQVYYRCTKKSPNSFGNSTGSNSNFTFAGS